MSASASCAVREPCAVLALLLLAAGLAWLRPLPDRGAPEPLPAATCETWMADAIPGVGPKSRAQVAAGIRAGSIPASAGDWFSR
jgi:hypothetical protein